MLSYVSVVQYLVLSKGCKSVLIEFFVFSVIKEHLNHFLLVAGNLHFTFCRNSSTHFSELKKE